jgi:hypothetical protein
MASRSGRAASLPYGRPRPDLDLLGYRKSIVDIDAEISHCALNFLVAKQKLNRWSHSFVTDGARACPIGADVGFFGRNQGLADLAPI